VRFFLPEIAGTKKSSSFFQFRQSFIEMFRNL